MEQVYSYLLLNISVTYAVVLFFFGTAVGSFLNVVIYRLPHGLSLLIPPSSCPECGARIFGLDNLPILSWLHLGGRCRRCRARISWRYPAIEAMTGVLWAAVGYINALNDHGHWQNIGLLLLYLAFVSSLVAVTFIDVDHQIIPDSLSLGGLAVVLGASAFLTPLHRTFQAAHFPASPRLGGLLGAFLGAGVGGGLLLAVSLLGTVGFRGVIRRAQEEDPDIRTAIGLGDVKLMAFVGALLGWQAVLAAFFLGTCIGAAGGAVVKIWTGSRLERKAEDQEAGVWRAIVYRWQSGGSIIPYGPFLVIGALLLFFMREPILQMFAEHVFHTAKA